MVGMDLIINQNVNTSMINTSNLYSPYAFFLPLSLLSLPAHVKLTWMLERLRRKGKRIIVSVLPNDWQRLARVYKNKVGTKGTIENALD